MNLGDAQAHLGVSQVRAVVGVQVLQVGTVDQ